VNAKPGVDAIKSFFFITGAQGKHARAFFVGYTFLPTLIFEGMVGSLSLE
jgi:hypothetical protein